MTYKPTNKSRAFLLALGLGASCISWAGFQYHANWLEREYYNSFEPLGFEDMTSDMQAFEYMFSITAKLEGAHIKWRVKDWNGHDSVYGLNRAYNKDATEVWDYIDESDRKGFKPSKAYIRMLVMQHAYYRYYKDVGIDKVKSLSVRAALFDMHYHFGPKSYKAFKYAVKPVVKRFFITDEIAADMNSRDPEKLFNEIQKGRVKYAKNLSKKSAKYLVSRGKKLEKILISSI